MTSTSGAKTTGMARGCPWTRLATVRNLPTKTVLVECSKHRTMRICTLFLLCGDSPETGSGTRTQRVLEGLAGSRQSVYRRYQGMLKPKGTMAWALQDMELH